MEKKWWHTKTAYQITLEGYQAVILDVSSNK